jgi:hypothetical protein
LNNPISTKNAYKHIKHQSKNSPGYESNLFLAIVHLFLYAYARRDIELKHRSNRNSKRQTNKNMLLKSTSIVELMRDFLSKKYLYNTYTKPQDLMFFRKSYREYVGPIKFSTLYSSFKELNSPAFQKKFPTITFTNLARDLQTQMGFTLTGQKLSQDYDAIILFINTF